MHAGFGGRLPGKGPGSPNVNTGPRWVAHPTQPGREQDPGHPPLGPAGERRTVPDADKRVVGQPDRGAFRALAHLRHRYLGPPEPHRAGQEATGLSALAQRSCPPPRRPSRPAPRTSPHPQRTPATLGPPQTQSRLTEPVNVRGHRTSWPTRTERSSRYARRASAWRPARYSASRRWNQNRSRSGCSVVSASSSATVSWCRPQASCASTRDSTTFQAVLLEPRLLRTSKGELIQVSQGRPRHRASDSSSSRTAAVASPAASAARPAAASRSKRSTSSSSAVTRNR